jgi:hypothetical protein
MRPNIPVTAFRARHAQEFAAGSGVAPWHRAAGLQGGRVQQTGASGSSWPQRLRSRISLVWKSLRARLHGTTGSLDHPLEGSSCRTSVLVEGWFFALLPAAATGRVWIDGQVVAELALDQDRPDVRAALRPLDPPLRCGFRQRVALPERLRSDGVARLWVEVWTGSRRAMRLGPVRITTTRR